MTNAPEIRDRSAVKSAVIASTKYCWSRAALRSVNGSTTSDSGGDAPSPDLAGCRNSRPRRAGRVASNRIARLRRPRRSRDDAAPAAIAAPGWKAGSPDMRAGGQSLQAAPSIRVIAGRAIGAGNRARRESLAARPGIPIRQSDSPGPERSGCSCPAPAGVENTAQRRNLDRQIAFLDRHPRPDRVHDLVFRDKGIGRVDQNPRTSSARDPIDTDAPLSRSHSLPRRRSNRTGRREELRPRKPAPCPSSRRAAPNRLSVQGTTENGRPLDANLRRSPRAVPSIFGNFEFLTRIRTFFGRSHRALPIETSLFAADRRNCDARIGNFFRDRWPAIAATANR